VATLPARDGDPPATHDDPLAQGIREMAPLPEPEPWVPAPAPTRVVGELPATKVERVKEDTRRRLARYTT
jgi:hypothetical protein